MSRDPEKFSPKDWKLLGWGVVNAIITGVVVGLIVLWIEARSNTAEIVYKARQIANDGVQVVITNKSDVAGYSIIGNIEFNDIIGRHDQTPGVFASNGRPMETSSFSGMNRIHFACAMVPPGAAYQIVMYAQGKSLSIKTIDIKTASGVVHVERVIFSAE